MMSSDVVIQPLVKPVHVRFDGNVYTLPDSLSKKIDAHWGLLMAAGRPYTRGPIYTLVGFAETPEAYDAIVQKSDYAHYQYTHGVGDAGEYGIRLLHAAAIIITDDDRVIFGRMGAHTGRPGMVQLSGGALDAEDLTSDGDFDLDHSAQREVREELGIDCADASRVASCTPAYLKTRGRRNVSVVIYRIDLRESAVAFLDSYESFARELRARGEVPEYDEVFALSLERAATDAFVAAHGAQCDETIVPLLETLLRDSRASGRSSRSRPDLS